MAVITVRNLPEQTHRALKVRAAEHGRSTEAEIREILKAAVQPKSGRKLGSEIAAIAERLGGFEFETVRDQTPAEPASFE